MFIRYLHTVAIVILLFASAANGQPLRRLKGDAKGVAGAGAGNAKKGVAEVESAKKGVAGVAGSRNTKKGVAGVAGVEEEEEVEVDRQASQGSQLHSFCY